MLIYYYIIGTDANTSDRSTRRRKDDFNDLIKEFFLKNIKNDNIPTFHHNNGTSESNIDYILYFIPEKSPVSINFHTQPCTKENPTNVSAHDPVIGEISLPINTTIEENSETDYTKTYTDFEKKRPLWTSDGKEAYQREVGEKLGEVLENFSDPEHVPVMTAIFSEVMVKSAELNFEVKVPKSNKVRKSPFFSKERRKAYQDHANADKEWRKKGRPTDKDNPLNIARKATRA